MTLPSLRAWFRPGLLGLHAFAIAAVGFCVGMGWWQLGIYDMRQDTERANQGSRPVVALEAVWGPDEPFERGLENRRVRVEGRFAATDEQIWVTGRDRDGAWLVAPFRVGAASLLVVRGRADRPGDPPSVPPGDVTFEAVLAPSEGMAEPFDPARRTIGSLSVPSLLNVLPGDLYSGFAIVTTEAIRGGLAPVEPPAPEVSWTVGLRNLAYALQWWVFGAFALFMWWRMASENVAMRRAQAEAETVTDPSLG